MDQLSRTGSLQVPLQNIQTPTSHISPLSGPLFMEDRLSTSIEQEICDQEVTTIIHEKTPARSPANTIPSRPGSIATVDYSTQGDLHESGHPLVTGLVREQTSILNICNYLLPDGTGRRILDIQISERKPFVWENGHTAYQIQLETLELVLETSTYLLDRLTGQFHAVYDDGYRTMTHARFGLPPKEAPSPTRQPPASQCLPPAVIQRSRSHAQNTAGNGEAVPDLTNQPPPPRTVEYLKPSFSLERPVCRLEMDKRLEVHNNFISAISNKMHKLNLICRLKKSEPHNAVHYQRQLDQHLMQHDDVIHQLIDIMKADDYFRRTEDLPLINPLTTHEEIVKFPELFDVHEAVSRVTTEVDILGRHIDDQVCTPYLNLPYQLHLALYPTGLVQHLNLYTQLHHQPHPDKLHKDHPW